VALMKAMKDFT